MSSEYTSTEITTLNQVRKPSRVIPLTILFLILVLLFTLIKLPQAKITNLIQGYVQTALDPMGIYLSDRGRELSILKGFEYRLDHPTLELPDGTRVELDEMIVSPSLLSLLKGKMGATMTMTQGAAHIDFTGTGKGDRVDATIKLDNCDLARLGVFAFAGIKGAGLVSGEVRIEGSLNDLPSLTGGAQLKLKKVHLDEQNISGIQLPPINIAEGTVDVNIENGKLVAKNVNLGKASDDVQLAVTGDMTLNRFMNASVLNLRAVFGMSEKVHQAVAFVDSFIAGAKQADGKYAFKLTGTIGSPFPVPDPGK